MNKSDSPPPTHVSDEPLATEMFTSLLAAEPLQPVERSITINITINGVVGDSTQLAKQISELLTESRGIDRQR